MDGGTLNWRVLPPACSPYASETVESSDAYLAVGCVFNDYSSAGYTMLLKKQKMIQVAFATGCLAVHHLYVCMRMASQGVTIAGLMMHCERSAGKGCISTPHHMSLQLVSCVVAQDRLQTPAALPSSDQLATCVCLRHAWEFAHRCSGVRY